MCLRIKALNQYIAQIHCKSTFSVCCINNSSSICLFLQESYNSHRLYIQAWSPIIPLSLVKIQQAWILFVGYCDVIWKLTCKWHQIIVFYVYSWDGFVFTIYYANYFGCCSAIYLYSCSFYPGIRVYVPPKKGNTEYILQLDFAYAHITN